MPYTYRKQGSKYCVYKKDGGDKVGCTDGNKTALRRYMTALHMHEIDRDIAEMNALLSEDLRAWFGKGGKGGVGGGGWDRYNSKGERIGKCGDAKEGDAYAACLSKEKARKLGKAGRAAFVKRKRAAQRKGGDAKKGGEQRKGQKPVKVKTGANEEMTPQQYQTKGMPFKGKTDINEIGEASSKPYKYKVDFEEIDPDFSEIQYKFKTDSNLEYQISISQVKPLRDSKKVRLVVAFRTIQGTYNTDTNKNEQFRIMATVVAATKEYLSKTPNATEISFTPSKTDRGDMRRANFYKAYIKKQMPGSKIQVFSDGRYIVELPKKPTKAKPGTNEAIVGDRIECDNCDHSWPISTGGKQPYLCHNCGYDNTPIESFNEIDYHAKLSRAHKPDWYQLHSSDFKPFNSRKNENLDPGTFKDTGKSSPYGSGYQELEERLNLFLEKNIPTNPAKWSYYKGQAKKKFDVYPSAYANAWAAKMYKKAGGGWRKEK